MVVDVQRTLDQAGWENESEEEAKDGKRGKGTGGGGARKGEAALAERGGGRSLGAEGLFLTIKLCDSK